ncbi:MAG: GTP cyclohydrolase I [Turicibacter sp.]|nr:GTP cyclohydrolase I [Turicibacter sp.]
MKKKIDTVRIEKAVTEILLALGDDPQRPGIVDTPKRVAKMYEQVFEGMTHTNDELVKLFGVTFEEDGFMRNDSDIVVVRDIPIFSYCEHHLALMYDMEVTIAYLPKEKVIGLSKLARIADMVGRRLQLQERLGKEIAEIVGKITESDAVCVLITGAHSCMTARGICKPGSTTTTVTYEGKAFEGNRDLRQEFAALMHK